MLGWAQDCDAADVTKENCRSLVFSGIDSRALMGPTGSLLKCVFADRRLYAGLLVIAYPRARTKHKHTQPIRQMATSFAPGYESRTYVMTQTRT
jgi:hypothetical protein